MFDHRCIDAVARSNHPNIAQVQDRWADQWPSVKVYVQTELCYGDLNQYIEANRNAATQIDQTAVWEIMVDIVEGLTYAHELGWSHRNLKPRNGISPFKYSKLIPVLAKQNGTDAFGRPKFTWKICDWGVAPALLPPPTVDEAQTHIPTSDDCYRAPEHRFSPSAAVDIWSLGCILFELATNGVLAFPINPEDPTYIVENGKVPTKMATMKTPQVVADRDPRGHINRILTGCLNPIPAERPTARQLGVYIRGILGRP
jgi:serine/threonine protein kinase